MVVEILLAEICQVRGVGVLPPWPGGGLRLTSLTEVETGDLAGPRSDWATPTGGLVSLLAPSLTVVILPDFLRQIGLLDSKYHLI